MTEKNIQRKYMQMQILRQQVEGMLQEKNMINERLAEINMTMDALKKLDDLKNGDEMWSTLGSGVFIGADIKDKDTVLVSVGAGVVIRSKTDDAHKIIEKRFGEMSAIDKELDAEINAYADQINAIDAELQKMVEELKKEDAGKKK